MIIKPGIENAQPNFTNDRDAAKWYEGKPTRTEVINEVKRISELVKDSVNVEFVKIGQTLSQLIGMIRTQGLELEALVESLDKAAPGFREGYIKEFRRQSEFSMFLEEFTDQGQHSSKPIREKLDMVRAWNAREDVVQVYGDKFIFKKYIESHNNDFTPEELVALESEFGVTFTVPPIKEAVSE